MPQMLHDRAVALLGEAALVELAGKVALGVIGDGRDTANAALFLASNEARFIAATGIVADGGVTSRCD